MNKIETLINHKLCFQHHFIEIINRVKIPNNARNFYTYCFNNIDIVIIDSYKDLPFVNDNIINDRQLIIKQCYSNAANITLFGNLNLDNSKHRISYIEGYVKLDTGLIIDHAFNCLQELDNGKIVKRTYFDCTFQYCLMYDIHDLKTSYKYGVIKEYSLTELNNLRFKTLINGPYFIDEYSYDIKEYSNYWKQIHANELLSTIVEELNKLKLTKIDDVLLSNNDLKKLVEEYDLKPNEKFTLEDLYYRIIV